MVLSSEMKKRFIKFIELCNRNEVIILVFILLILITVVELVKNESFDQHNCVVSLYVYSISA